jgi:hypothetical protein
MPDPLERSTGPPPPTPASITAPITLPIKLLFTAVHDAGHDADDIRHPGRPLPTYRFDATEIAPHDLRQRVPPDPVVSRQSVPSPFVPYRFIYIGLGALAVAVVALAFAFGKSGDPIELPGPVEAVFPLPGDAVLMQAFVEVDMQVGYTVDIYVDGFLVPEGEVNFVEATGVYRWAPSPASLYLDSWTPGEHTVRIVWDTVAGLPDRGEFTWTFRVQ